MRKNIDFYKDDCDRGNVFGMCLLFFWIIVLFNLVVGCGWVERSREKYLGVFLVDVVSLGIND